MVKLLQIYESWKDEMNLPIDWVTKLNILLSKYIFGKTDNQMKATINLCKTLAGNSVMEYGVQENYANRAAMTLLREQVFPKNKVPASGIVFLNLPHSNMSTFPTVSYAICIMIPFASAFLIFVMNFVVLNSSLILQT